MPLALQEAELGVGEEEEKGVEEEKLAWGGFGVEA